MTDFVHLHCHSSASLLDGLGNPSKWVDAAVAKGFKALAITDHASISSAAEFTSIATEKGLQPIVGCEFYVTDDPSFRPSKKSGEKMLRYHLTVLAKNWNGLQSIFRQLTIANRQFYYRPLLSTEQIFDFKDCVIMTACAVGVLSHPDYSILTQRLKKVYGDDLYLEVMPHLLVSQKEVNSRAEILSKMHGIKPVATNDAHYPTEEDTETQDILLAIQTRAKLTDEKRFSFLHGDEGLSGLYLRDAKEMVTAFLPWLEEGVFDKEFLTQAFLSTVEIARKCSRLEIPTLPYELPCISGVEKGEVTEYKALMDLCIQGWKRLIKGKVSNEAQYAARLKHELGVIVKIGAVRYFLIVWDIINWAKDNNILCGFGRGSAGGSLVCYLLGIHNMDPIEHHLYFERFLREDRIDMPDIDLDFAANDRENVIKYIEKTYGKDCVCQISTSTKMHGKTAFRDVARVYGIPPARTNELSKRIDKDLSIEENFSQDIVLAEFAKENETHAEIVKHAIRLDSQLRAKGVHPGGIVISQDGFAHRGVLERRSDATCINWSMEECDRFGLLKVDILSLNNLSILHDVAKMAKANYGADIDFFSIKPDDPEVLKQYAEGQTIGFFQFESPGIRQLCKRLAPITDFETLVNVNALYRPGPLDSGMTESYVKRKIKEEAVTYRHPKEAPIAESTFGLPIFQEQIMRLFVDLAGFSWPEADTMRKLIAKSKGAAKLEEKRIPFVEGCKATSGIKPEVANEIYNEIVKFGRYGFNRSHAACYMMISYLTAWCKHHYPVEFMCALLTAAAGDDEDTEKYINEAKRLGIHIQPPEINQSQEIFSTTPEKDGKFAIVCGFSSLKGIGPAASKAIFKARAEGDFKDYEDFLRRTPRNAVKKNHVVILAKAGAFRNIEPHTKWICETYSEITAAIADPKKWDKVPSKLSIVDHSPAEKLALKVEAVPGVFGSEDVEAVASMQIEKDFLTSFNELIKGCKDCKLSEGPGEPVSIKWSRDSRVLVVTDYPGGREESNDEPLQNQQMMDLFKEVCGLTPGKLFKAHVFNCRPPRTMPEDILEKWHCPQTFLERLIILTQPTVIFSMGSTSYRFFSGKKSGILKANGTAVFHPKYKAVVVYSISPGSLFGSNREEKESSIRAALKKLNQYL